jgi:DNA polymerase (family X)
MAFMATASTAPRHNPEIARALDDLADFLEIEGANAFRVRAYRNAARLVRGLGTDISDKLARGDDLAELPGIGADLAGKIAELAKSGHIELLDRLRRSTPPVAQELLRLPGLGPKRVKELCDGLDIRTVEQLHRALLDGRVRELQGFGPASEAKLLKALERRPSGPSRWKLALADSLVQPLLKYMKRAPGIETITVAGSYRRSQETVGDIDILATARQGAPVVKHFTAYAEVEKIAAAGPTRATVVLRAGLQIDLRVVAQVSRGAALVYFTGSKAHNIAIRRLGQELGLKINEYGAFRGETRIAGRTEQEVYGAVGLPYIEPELRENRGEIEAAAAGRLPRLVEFEDLKGDLHAHTKASDGSDTLPELVAAAKARGHDYIAVTDHSHRLAITHGLDEKGVMRAIDAIDRINAGKPGIAVLKGIEVDILEDGSLDLPDRVLARLDLVIGAIHSSFGLSRAKQTGRILRAMERRYFTVLAHPTGRLIAEREPYDVDMPRIVHAAAQRGCHLELNAHPDRLDLTDIHCRMAKDEGVLVSIATDAHRDADLDNLRFGIGQARRGWLEKADVLNSRSLAALRPLLARTMG